MIKSELFYDDERGALFEDGKLVEYWPASQDDYHIGAICILRITQIFKKQKRAQCQLPNGSLVSFRLTDAKGLSAGSFCWLTLTAQPRQHKPWQAEQGISRAGKIYRSSLWKLWFAHITQSQRKHRYKMA